jgi:hypothetical protein
MSSTPEPLDRHTEIAIRAAAFRSQLAAFLDSPVAVDQWASIMTAAPNWSDTVEPLHRLSNRERAERLVAAERAHLDADWTFALTREAQRAIKPVVADTSWSAPVLEGKTSLEPRGLMYFHRPVAFDALIPIVAATWGPVPAGGAGLHLTGWGQVPPGVTLPTSGAERAELMPCVDAIVGLIPDAVDRRLIAGAHPEYSATRFVRSVAAAWYGVKTEALSYGFSYEADRRVVVLDAAEGVDAPSAITGFMGELWAVVERGGPLLDIDSVGQ